MVKKTLASLLASVMVFGAAVPETSFVPKVNAINNGYESVEQVLEESPNFGKAFLLYADAYWDFYNMSDYSKEDINDWIPKGGAVATVTKDGTYKVNVSSELMDSTADYTPYGANVICVDIYGLADIMGVSTNEDAWDDYCTDVLGIKPKKATSKDKMAYARTSGLDVTELSLYADGYQIYTYEPDEILFGDEEGNGNIRIELFNQWGDTRTMAPDTIKDFAQEGEYNDLEVEFTIKGIHYVHDYKKVKTDGACVKYVCKDCGYSYSVDHDFDFTGSAEPSCTEQYVCKECGYIYSGDHDYEFTGSVEASCTESSYSEFTCKNCGDKYKEYSGKPLGHCFSVTKKGTIGVPKCEIDEETIYTCDICGYSYTKSVPAPGHKYKTKVVKPTYTSNGYTLHTCSVCGKSYKDTYTAKLARTSIAKARITGLKNKTYTGKAIKQTPVIKLGKKTLKAGTDYTVSYKNNKAVGTATVTVTGKGAYTGTAKATFKINPKKTTLKTVKSPKTKQIKATYSKVAGVTGYQVTYSTSKKFTKKTTKSVTVKGTSKTISKLKKGRMYYVKVRTYKTVKGTKYYSGYSAVKKIKVK